MNRRGARTRGRQLAFAVALLLPAAARAQISCPAPRDASATTERLEGRVRLEWIDDHLSRERDRARSWNWGWAIGIAVAGGVAALPAAFVIPNNRIDYYTGAGLAAVGVLPFLVAPPAVIDDAGELHERLQAFQPETESEVCIMLADAEARLVRDARNEQLLTSGYAHAGNVLVNTGVFLFLGFGFHHWGAGAVNGLAGLVVGEAVILSTPTQAIRDLDRYRRGDLGP